MISIPQQTIDSIITLCAEHCGALPSYGEQFFAPVYADPRPMNKVRWRFMGKLGLGGTLNIEGPRVFVSCHPDDRTPARDTMVETCNQAIYKLLQGGPHAAP